MDFHVKSDAFFVVIEFVFATIMLVKQGWHLMLWINLERGF